MKKTALIIAAMCAVICTGAVGCNGNNDSKPTRNDTSVTPQDKVKPSEANNHKTEYVPVSIEGMSVIKSGWIKLPAGTEYLVLLNSIDDSYANGYAYPNQPADVYKEEGDYVLVKTRDVVGYLPKENFTTEEPATQAAQTTSAQ